MIKNNPNSPNKQCTDCSITKSKILFPRDKTRFDGYHYYCKDCQRSRKRDHRNRNRDKINAYRNKISKRLYLKNKEKISERRKKARRLNPEKSRLQSKRSNLKNKEWIRNYSKEYTRHRRKTKPLVKLSNSLRVRLKGALRRRSWKKTSTLQQYLGCTIQEFKEYIELLFKPGMTWDNHTINGWHIDHIIPLSSAQTEEEIYKLNHFSNLQPMWAIDNIRKSNKRVNNE